MALLLLLLLQRKLKLRCVSSFELSLKAFVRKQVRGSLPASAPPPLLKRLEKSQELARSHAQADSVFGLINGFHARGEVRDAM